MKYTIPMNIFGNERSVFAVVLMAICEMDCGRLIDM